ncbi:GH36-type glycosyl hydrolase domain-containing protein [Leuconostoc falkenbergense]|uniref:GH36-type glycosyl hydrolase domain-containing protein n=1 Tax=Leuconostoc falkenbergense TaxID=2766470 RepID=UPI0024A86C9E|nr:amylo-alpha-1,6-glucosidase [Leuconostoc falkenbergense]MDI6552214.1 amylo-alpha-1,6-glucosidase [Leuconostoc falkenbergense]
MPVIQDGRTKINLLDNGAISKIISGNIMVNQIEGNNLDGSFANIFLRVKQANQYNVHPLTGPLSNSEVNYSSNSVTWTGNFETVSYRLNLLIDDDTWFWEVDLEADQEKTVDVTYTQDLGLGIEKFVKTNETYASQYIDHLVLNENDTIAIASRQNQSQSGQYPYLQEGSFDKLTSYSTDAYQFFGTEYKQDSIPKAFQQSNLDNFNKQNESAYTALRTGEIKISTDSVKIVFYASFQGNQPLGNKHSLIDLNKLHKRYHAIVTIGESKKLQPVTTIQPMNQVLAGEKLTEAELDKFFPKKIQVEKNNKQILSFFNSDGSHVVLPEKEKRQDRLSGNIVLSSLNRKPGVAVLASTQYVTGIFESHSVYANSDSNILSTDTRGAFNIFKISGTRIFVYINGEYQILGMPSLFVMHYNGADWYYKVNDDFIKISDDANSSNNQLTLRFESLKNKQYDILVTTQVDRQTLGADYQSEFNNDTLEIMPGPQQLMAEKMPDLGYKVDFSKYDGKTVDLSDEKILFDKKLEFPTNQVIAKYHDVTNFIVQTGIISDDLKLEDQFETRQAHAKNIKELLRSFHLTTSNSDKIALIERTNLILPWFAHDALVHLMSPHGLEQPSGAAWGTRDVSQGPTELFLATGHYSEVREIIMNLYSHQFADNGNWPQWFMFDQYSGIYANESHGDVIVWPMKVVADYLAATHDMTILQDRLPYLSQQTKKMTNENEKLIDHLVKQINYIENNFLYDTSVSAYGDGDWDDTLQPADASQKQEMASTWTEELTIEVLRKMAHVLEIGTDLQERCAQLADKMYEDFKKYFLQTDVLPGFIKMNSNHEVQQIIYPGDQKTGINYRLLPLSQGVLSKVLTGSKAQNALNIIKENLLYADGVRLMDRPAQYHGGVSQIFKRAEQSANFGREIGLLYVHAHIRYAEAIAVNGDKNEAWRLLDLVNPINLTDRVPNAAIRQSNVYFSSSDADFNTRYEAQENYDQLSKQSISVKGGWRLYSSGPGIFISALLQNIMTSGELGQNSTLPFDSDVHVTMD